MNNSTFNPDWLIQTPKQLTDATPDVMPHILNGLSRQDVARLMRTCRELRDSVKDACGAVSIGTPFINSQNIGHIREAFKPFISRSPVFEPVPAFMIGDIITLAEHRTAVCCVEKLSDTLLASGSTDHTIKIWNFHTGECIATENYGSPIYNISLLPENHLALGLHNGSIKLLGGSFGE